MAWIFFFLWLPFCYGLENVQIGIFRPIYNESLAQFDDAWLQQFSDLLLNPSPIQRRSHRLQKRVDIEDVEEETFLEPVSEPDPPSSSWFRRQWDQLYEFFWNRKLSKDTVTVDKIECPVCYRESDVLEGVIETSK
jgi:hypothetical protein